MDSAHVEQEEYYNKETGEYQREKPVKPDNRFVRVPLLWITTAASLPGKATEVGLALWYLRFIQKKQAVKLTSAWCATFSITRQQKYRALQTLQEAGLVSIESEDRKNPVVTLLDAQPTV